MLLASRAQTSLGFVRGLSSTASTVRRFSAPTTTTEGTTAVASTGDLVSVRYELTTADGAPLPEANRVFDTGAVRLVVDGGGFLPCVHNAVRGLAAGEKRTLEVPAAEAFGETNPDMGPVEIPAAAAPDGLEVGMRVRLVTGAAARVTAMTDETVTIDANDPMAGVGLKVEAEVLVVDPGASTLETADFALGCFWGAELAFQREKGVVATKVGYTQGEKLEPTYQEVCSGATGHTEGVQVAFDPAEVSYERLCELFWERLGESRYLLNQVGNDRGTQYRHGIYWHGAEQKAAAEASLEAQALLGPKIHTEVMEAAKFWDAEDYHMQYLQKGGQDARKQATETIRCYG